MDCPCGSGSPYADCCEPFHKGTAAPPTAVALMRSRYSAYVQGEIDYIIGTHSPAGSEGVDREATEQWANESEWLGLDIVDTAAGGPDDDKGIVEFIARFRVGDAEHAHHERSEFVKLDGRWLYDHGHMVKAKPVTREAPKVGRNEPCPCGSGTKYKKCHGAA